MNPIVVFAGVVAILVSALLFAEALVYAMASRAADRRDAAEAQRRRELVRALNAERPMRWTDGGAS